MSILDNAIKKILDSTSLEERMASIVRVCDVDKWKDGEYHGNANEVAHILAKEVKRWMDDSTAPLFKPEEHPTEPTHTNLCTCTGVTGTDLGPFGDETCSACGGLK